MSDKVKIVIARNAYLARLSAFNKENVAFACTHDAVKAAKKTRIAAKTRLESKIYDDRWPNELEAGFAAIDKILQNPRRNIKEVGVVVEAGLAKKINSTSVMHLASHTQYIREVATNGDVIPDKILNIDAEDDYQIYENRFVMTLIKKAIMFVERRYQFIASHAETRDSSLLKLHTELNIDGIDYEVDTRVRASKPSEDGGMAKKNEELLKKITLLRARALFYARSPFMAAMEGAKPVHSPISMTNLIVKNPDYHKAYLLWRFLDSYTKLGVNYQVKETTPDFDEDYSNAATGLLTEGLLTLQHQDLDKLKVLKERTKSITPKVGVMLDDETFLDGKYDYHPFVVEGADKIDYGETPEEQAKALQKEKERQEKIRELEEKREAELAAKAEANKQKQDEKEQKARQEAERRVEIEVQKAIAKMAILQHKEEEARAKAAEDKRKREAAEAEAEERRRLQETRDRLLREGAMDAVALLGHTQRRHAIEDELEQERQEIEGRRKILQEILPQLLRDVAEKKHQDRIAAIKGENGRWVIIKKDGKVVGRRFVRNPDPAPFSGIVAIDEAYCARPEGDEFLSPIPEGTEIPEIEEKPIPVEEPVVVEPEPIPEPEPEPEQEAEPEGKKVMGRWVITKTKRADGTMATSKKFVPFIPKPEPKPEETKEEPLPVEEPITPAPEKEDDGIIADFAPAPTINLEEEP